MSAMLDTKAAAEHLGLAKVTLDMWRSQGRGPRFVKMGRAVRYRMSDLDRWVEDHSQDARYDKAPPRKRGVRTTPGRSH